MKIRVYYEDVDIGGVVYHSRYINFCERARSDLFFRYGKSPFYEGYHFVVKELHADFLHPAFFGDILEVQTLLLWRKSASVKLQQTIFKDEKPIFVASVTLVCMHHRKIAKIPPYFQEIFHYLEN